MEFTMWLTQFQNTHFMLIKVLIIETLNSFLLLLFLKERVLTYNIKNMIKKLFKTKKDVITT